MGQGASASRPFSDRSFWNARPVKFTLGTTEVPKSDYFPMVAEGAYSVRVFVAKPTDPSMTVLGAPDKPGVWNADAERIDPQIVIPHWPADVLPATGGDGHADIVDAASNRIHSFYQLKFIDGKWRATQYAWSALDGRGWGEPGHYFQGSRATGIAPTAGLIRSFEVNDGLPEYQHALAMSMASNGLSANPAYVYPATSADSYAATNRGTFPEGTLMMLPADFDLASIKDARLLKVARTLQKRGAYVVDGNTGTPFVIYVEIGSNYSLMPPGKWDSGVAADLDRLRSGLRAVDGVTEWVDAKGVRFTPERNLNLLSMRGPWAVTGTGTAGGFDTWQQAVVFPDNGQAVTQVNASGRNMQNVPWAVPRTGETMRLKVTGTKGATMRFTLVDAAAKALYDSGALKAGQVVDFKWPAAGLDPAGPKPIVTVATGPGGGGTIGATLVSRDPRP